MQNVSGQEAIGIAIMFHFYLQLPWMINLMKDVKMDLA